jgi:hypothetical protein
VEVSLSIVNNVPIVIMQPDKNARRSEHVDDVVAKAGCVDGCV